MRRYTTKNQDISLHYVSKMVSYIMAYNDGKENFLGALEWAKPLMKEESIPYYKKNYSFLLYKAGKHKEAIDLMQNYINSEGADDQTAKDNISKMRQGEDIYW